MPNDAVGDWSGELFAARKALRLSQQALADRAGVSAQTIKSYELGLRHPSRDFLVTVLDTLRVERGKRDAILLGAGFAPDGAELGPDRTPGYMFDQDEAAAHAERQPWPTFVLNEYMEVVCANKIAQRLWGVDLKREFTQPIERSMLVIASNPRFADNVTNWDDMISVAIGVFKGHHRGAEVIEEPGTYFSQVLDRFLKGSPKYVGRFLKLWQSTTAIPHKVRWFYPVMWQSVGSGLPPMRFRALVTTCNEPTGLAFNDWIPLDSETWRLLEQT